VRRALLLAAAAFTALALIACGDDDDGVGGTTTAPTADASATGDADSPSASAATHTGTDFPPEGAAEFPPGTGAGSSEPGVPLDPGQYYTTAFTPAFAISLGEGWGMADEREQGMLLLRQPEPGDIALTFDSAGTEDVDLTVSRYTSITGTEASAVADTAIAGIPAKRFDVTIVDSRVDIPRLDEAYTSFGGDTLRFWVLDVNGTTLKIIAEAPGDDFDLFAQVADNVIATIVFG
jgi:hypothetical protein